MTRCRTLVFLFALLKWCHSSLAESNYPSTRVFGYQSLFSGETGESFAETSAGYGGGVAVFNRKANHFVPSFALKLTTLTGEQDFKDGTTLVESDFNFYAAATELSLLIFPIQRRRLGVNVYGVALGSLGYNIIVLDKDTELTRVPNSDQAFSYAYGTGIGAEWILSQSGNQWTLFGEFIFKIESTTLLERTFDLSSMSFVIGLGW